MEILSEFNYRNQLVLFNPPNPCEVGRVSMFIPIFLIRLLRLKEVKQLAKSPLAGRQLRTGSEADLVTSGSHFNRALGSQVKVLPILICLPSIHSPAPTPIALRKVDTQACQGSAQLTSLTIISQESVDHNSSSAPGKGYLLPQKVSCGPQFCSHSPCDPGIICSEVNWKSTVSQRLL